MGRQIGAAPLLNPLAGKKFTPSPRLLIIAFISTSVTGLFEEFCRTARYRLMGSGKQKSTLQRGPGDERSRNQ